ncbi:MAG: hypothetical protein F4X65_06345 [Chloroflexi bacterium]|nr:hypothetical protein [Chloroflexota bacterium]
MSKTTILMMVDGLDPEYLRACPTPTLQELATLGFMTEGTAMVPTVTNVNNASLLTAQYPSIHGITSNYWLDRDRKTESYMDSGQFIESETIFERAAALGRRSLLVTAKEKLRNLLGHETFVSISAECPPPWLVNAIGAPPPMYSLEVNRWIVDAARCVLSRCSFDIAYLATTDYPMHAFAPEDPESALHLELLDNAIGRLMEGVDCEILITADHGMSAKTRMLNLPEHLLKNGIVSRAVPIVKDRYTVHHSNLGGCIYIYLLERDRHTLAAALEILRGIDGVDRVVSRDEALLLFGLMPNRIGDLVALGARDVVFGNPDEVCMPEKLRSHGSLHEQRVPIIGYGGDFEGFDFTDNRDLGRYVFERVLGF